MNYALSTIGLIIYFVLVALQSFSIYSAPSILMGIVAAFTALMLIVRK